MDVPYAACSSRGSLCVGFIALRRLFFGAAFLVAGALCSRLSSALLCDLASYSVASLSMAHMIPDNRRASATAATLFPRRCAIPSAHVHSAVVFGFFSRMIRCAACTSITLTRATPARNGGLVLRCPNAVGSSAGARSGYCDERAVPGSLEIAGDSWVNSTECGRSGIRCSWSASPLAPLDGGLLSAYRPDSTTHHLVRRTLGTSHT